MSKKAFGPTRYASQKIKLSSLMDTAPETTRYAMCPAHMCKGDMYCKECVGRRLATTFYCA